jgi:ABC-type dipeptide/oligopeptide/nickel transport system permease subunit
VKPERSPLLVVGTVMVVVLAAAAALAPFLAPHDPRAITGDSLERPSAHHLLGTNDVGQDIFSQVIWGTRTSMVVAVAAASLIVLLGVLVGAWAGLQGGMVDLIAMRVVDVILAMPRLPLLVLVGALAGPNLAILVLMIGLTAWPEVARIVRSQILTLRARGYVSAARAFGAKPSYVVRRHLVPAVAPLLVASFVNWAAIAIGLESGLAFLGLGDPVSVSWGQILDRALLHPGLFFTSLWTWWVLPAGLAITLAVMAFTFLGVGLEPRFNPRWQRAT